MKEWRTISGFEGFYEVSNEGEIRSTDRQVRSVIQEIVIRKGRLLKVHPNQSGYLTVKLCNGPSRMSQKTVHRIVAEAFIDNPNGKPFINHKNGIKTDNRVENLEWCTQSENIQHAWRAGLSGKYDLEFMESIRKYIADNPRKSVARCAETFNVSSGLIYNIIKRKLKKR